MKLEPTQRVAPAKLSWFKNQSVALSVHTNARLSLSQSNERVEAAVPG